MQEVESRIEALRVAERPSDAAKAQPAKPQPRGFAIPASPTGAPDVIDRIVEQGGILSKGKMAKAPGFSAADYEGLTTLPGVYKRLLSGKLSPDKMAAQLGLDGPQALAEEIYRALATRKSAGTEAQRQATLEKQAQRLLPILAGAPLDADVLLHPLYVGCRRLAEGHFGIGSIDILAFEAAMLFLEGCRASFGDREMRSLQRFPNLFAIEKKPSIIPAKLMTHQVLEPRFSHVSTVAGACMTPP